MSDRGLFIVIIVVLLGVLAVLVMQSNNAPNGEGWKAAISSTDEAAANTADKNS